MKVLYILNDSLFYKRMTLYSLWTLRQFEPSLPVEVVWVPDGQVNNRNVGWYSDFDWGLGHIGHEEFLLECERFGVVVTRMDYDNGEETGFHSSLRGALSGVSGENIFLMDSDTIFFGGISDLFGHLDEYDVVADKTRWSKLGVKLPLEQGNFMGFNSGVVLFRGKLLQDYASVVRDYALDIKHERNRLSQLMMKWDKEHNGDIQVPLGREEMAFSCWVLDRGLKYRYFDASEVQTESLTGLCRIFHTMTNNWGKYWALYFSNGYFRVPFRGRRRVYFP
jgi:hypothetical protein